MNSANSVENCVGIAAVERDTGLGKDTLRVWERRYGFPKPLRDSNGDRLYPVEQLEKLRLIRRLLDQGNRPARVVGASLEELTALVELQAANLPAQRHCPGEIDLQAFIDSIKLHRSIELRAALQQLLLKQGLQRFVSETVTALNAEVGMAWMRGELDVPEEHLYTEQVQNVLRSAIGSHASGEGRPRILLTTFPDELHGLGLLMVEAMLVPEGAVCVSLGIQTPITDIVNAASAGNFDIVALSFSGAFPLRQALEGLSTLRAQTPDHIEIWVGGAALQGKDKRLTGVQLVQSLVEAVEQLQRWRVAHTQ